MFLFDSFGIKRDIKHLNAVERLFALKEKAGSNPWPVIDECFKMWESTNPSEYKSFLVQVDDLRHTRKDRKYASTTDKVTGGILRYTLDIPEKVLNMIRCVYSAEELPMDRKFFMEFSKRFPRTKIAEKL